MRLYTTLNRLSVCDPNGLTRVDGQPLSGWRKLLNDLGKTQEDDEPLSLRVILQSNGLDDALWCLQAVDERETVCVELAKRFAQLGPRFGAGRFEPDACVERYAQTQQCRLHHDAPALAVSAVRLCAYRAACTWAEQWGGDAQDIIAAGRAAKAAAHEALVDVFVQYLHEAKATS